MKKTTRVSIVLIAVGVLLIIEAYAVPSGKSGFGTVVRQSRTIISEALFVYRGQTLECSITTNASVNFYVTDETNYLAFANGNSWQPLVSLRDVSSESFNIVAPATGYYRTIAVVKKPQGNATLDTSMKYYGINLDYYQPGLTLAAIGAVLITIDAILYLKSRSSKKPPGE